VRRVRKSHFVRQSRFVSCMRTQIHKSAGLFVHICLHLPDTRNFMQRVTRHIPELRKMVSGMTQGRFHVSCRPMNLLAHTRKPAKKPDKSPLWGSPQTIWTAVLGTPTHMMVLVLLATWLQCLCARLGVVKTHA
jgi:hypothetical protein